MSEHLLATARMVLMTAAAALLAAWFSPAGAAFGACFELYQEREYDRAIEECKMKKDLSARLAVALSYAEKAGLYKNKLDKDQKKAYLNMLAVDATTLEALPVLDRYLDVRGNIHGRKEALKLLDKVMDKARSPRDVTALVPFLDFDKEEDVNKAALAGLYRHLKTLRDYVKKGGHMPPDEIELFQDPKLIVPVADLLGRKKLASLAAKCLVQIEEPALDHLESLELDKTVSGVIVKIKKEMTKRKKKYPESTWYSTFGD